MPRTVSQVDARLTAEITARAAADAKLDARLKALEAPTVPTPVPTPTPVPPGAIEIRPGDPLSLSAGKTYLLRGGTHRISFGSGDRREANVSILPYPGEAVIVEPSGDQHFLYLGPGASFTLGAITLRGFYPFDSGIVAVGDGCSLTTLEGFTIIGRAALPGYVKTADDYRSHGVYFHGTGTGRLDKPVITDVPGSAIQSYRGSPVYEVNGGRIGGRYISLLAYSGRATYTGVTFTSPPAAWDIDCQVPAIVTTSGCTGTGANGSIRRIDHS